jgi:hypothetical protein
MNNLSLILLVVCAASFGLPALATATLINASFESDSFNGWRLNIPRGMSETSPRSRPAGTAQIISSWEQQTGVTPLRSAVEGNYFAAIGSLENGGFTDNRTYNITLTRRIHLHPGEILRGSAFFYNGDHVSQESAWVNIFDPNGQSIARPWFESSGGGRPTDPNSTPYATATPWTEWSWQALEEDTYTLSFGITTKGDNRLASYGFFDNLFIQPATTIVPVPEPSSITLAALGATGITALRRKNRHA